MMFATSLIGPENFREYSTKEEMFPRPITPFIYNTDPSRVIRLRPILLIKPIVGPMVAASESAS